MFYLYKIFRSILSLTTAYRNVLAGDAPPLKHTPGEPLVVNLLAKLTHRCLHSAHSAFLRYMNVLLVVVKVTSYFCSVHKSDRKL